MSDPEFKIRIGKPMPDLLLVHGDGRCYARSFGGEMVQVKFTRGDIERLKVGPVIPGGDPATHILRVLCEIIARELPVQRPS